MGQTESFAEADESQTDVDQDHPSPGRPRLVVGGRSSVERRRLSRPVASYSSSSNESLVEALLRQRRSSLHRKSSTYLAENGFKYPHPLYTTTTNPQQTTSSSPSHRIRGLKHAILPAKGRKSKSSEDHHQTPEQAVSPATAATNISTATQRKDAVEKQLLLANGKEPPPDFKHSNDPTSPPHNLVVASKENHRVADSEHNGSTSRSIGGEIDKTFAFLNSADATSQTTTVTEHSEPEGSDIHFNPEEFQTHTSTPKSKRKEDSQISTEHLDEIKDMMNVGGRSRYESSAAAAGAVGGGRGYSVSGASGHRAATKRSSSAAAATRLDRGSAEIAQSSASASSSKTSKKMSSKSTKKRSKSASRTRSDSSMSDMSAASKSSKGSVAKKVKEENKKRIKDRLTKSGHKGSITDRWQGVVNEFQDVKKLNRKGETKTTEQRKVSKIGNLDKYDNVKALFGKGLPMQHGPPPGAAARLRELEGETASEESTHSWTALTPMRRTTNTTINAGTGGEHRYQTRSYQQGVDAANRRGQSITGDRRIMAKDGRMSSDAYNIKGSRATANSSSNVTSGQAYKKGVKFQKKKGYDIQDEASMIVDDAIRRALGLFYGGKRVSSSGASRMGAATSRKQSSSSASRKSSAASSSSRALSEQRSQRSTTNNFIRDIKTENIYRESILKDLRGQRSMSSGGVGGVRKHSIRPIPGSGRRSEGSVLPPPVRKVGPLAPGGFYELDITPYGGQDKEKETQEQQQQSQRQYPEGTPTRFHVGGSSSQQNFSLPPIQQPTNTIPGQSIQTSASQISSSLQVNQDQTSYTQYSQNYMNGNVPFRDTPTVKTGVNPPTITKGNVTRVLHDLSEQNLARPAPGQQNLESFRSLDSSMDADYSTWPLTKNPSQTSTQYETTYFTSNMTEGVKLDTTGNYASLPEAFSVQHGLGTQQQQTPSLSANWDTYQSGPGYSYTSQTLSPENTYSIGVDTRKGAVNRLGQRQYLYPDSLERPASTPAVLQGHNMYSSPPSLGMYGAYATMPYNVSPGGGGYGHQRFYQTHYGSLGNLAQSTYQQHQQQPVNLNFQIQPNQYGNRRTQSYSNIISPSSPQMRTMPQPMQNGYYGSVSELMDYSAYSNEPIIVADLVDKKQTGTTTTATMATQVDGARFQTQSPGVQASSSFYSSKRSDSPAVNMRKQQTLNFFVFGDRSQSETNLKAASYDIEPRYVRDDFDVSGFYYDRERQRQYDQAEFYDYDDGDYENETRSEPDYNVNRWKEMVIHHKQTQTLPPPPKKKKPPVMKRIEKKEIQAYRQFPPKRFPPQVHHKETTHYITKDRQIEKIPPQPPKRFSHSVQTDLSGSVVHREKPRAKVQKYSSATQYEKPPSSPRKRDTQVQVTNRVFAPRVTETMDFFRESLQVDEPEEPLQTSGKEVPISLKQSPEENVVTIIEAFNQPTTTTTMVETTSSSQELMKKDDESDDSEMELIETVEVEEKEQRLSMAIFEEVEFHFERSKDGQKQEVQSGKGTDLLPFQFPGKYETTVDRRKQKCTQLRECTKGGSHRYEYDANINRHLPAPNYQSAIEMKRSDDSYFDDDDENLNMEGLVEQTQGMSLQNRNHNNRCRGGRDHHNQSSHISQHITSPSSPGFVQDDRLSSGGRQIRVVERSQHTNVPSSSSGYSSSDTTSSAVAHQSHYSISAGGPFEMPVHDESDEHEMSGLQIYTSELKDVNLTPPEEFSPQEHQENNVSKNSKYISRFDPENVYFTVPEWTATNNEIFNFDGHAQSNRRQLARGVDNDSLPESLPEITSSPDVPDRKKRISKRQKDHADTPKLRTRVVKDEHGKLIKITEVEKTVTRTEEFTEEDEEAARKVSANSEQLKEGEYVVMNLDEITEGQKVRDSSAQEEDVQSSEGEDEGEYNLVDAEVLGETTITQIPIEYDEQTTTMGLKDDQDHNFDEQKYLYDMKTATLSPVITKDSRSGAMLMQYGYNDMITEL